MRIFAFKNQEEAAEVFLVIVVCVCMFLFFFLLLLFRRKSASSSKRRRDEEISFKRRQSSVPEPEKFQMNDLSKILWLIIFGLFLNAILLLPVSIVAFKALTFAANMQHVIDDMDRVLDEIDDGPKKKHHNP